jgi:hypothetical protein
MAKTRTDAERRARQSERLSRLLRVLRCIMGPGRWDIEGLAREMECSPRTVHRFLQTLSMAGVPWYFDKESECYRVRTGFKFPGIEPIQVRRREVKEADPETVLIAARKFIAEGDRFLASLRQWCDLLAGISSAQHTDDSHGPR